jgi:hypothetical protein
VKIRRKVILNGREEFSKARVRFWRVLKKDSQPVDFNLQVIEFGDDAGAEATVRLGWLPGA